MKKEKNIPLDKKQEGLEENKSDRRSFLKDHFNKKIFIIIFDIIYDFVVKLYLKEFSIKKYYCG